MQRRPFQLIGYAAIVAALVAAAFWFNMRRSARARPSSQDSMSNMSGMTPPASPSPGIAPDASAEPRVDLTTDDLKKARIRTVRVTNGITVAKLRVPGVVKPNEYGVVHVTSLVGGIVKQVPVLLGDHVRRGQPLAVIFSSELAEAKTRYLTHLAELDADHKRLERTQKLVKLGAASRQEEEEVAAMHAGHEAEVRAALEKLKLLGADDRQLAALAEHVDTDSNVSVPAPINGVVLARHANLGLVANTAQELFTVADLSAVWVMASVNEKDFASVPVGSEASITAPAYRGSVWKGRVGYIQPQVDPNTRTAQARVEVSNPGERLRIDMYLDVEFTSQRTVSLRVPQAAVQSIGDRQFVFLPVKNNEGSFSLRQVRLGPAADGFYPVLEGLQQNDEVVTDGSFILKAETVRQHPELH